MDIKTLATGDPHIVELVSDQILINDDQGLLDLIANLPSDHVVLHEHNLAPACFDLSTRKLGDILQKCVNYQVKLAVVGDFEKYPSKSLRAFIYEINRYGDYLFVPSVEEAVRIWQRVG